MEDYSNQYCKYVFSEEEKKELAVEMARNVSNLQVAEDEKKAIVSDFKSTIDGLQAKINGGATKLNNGYEMRTVKCRIDPDWELKVWLYVREDNGEITKEKKMTADDLQRKINE